MESYCAGMLIDSGGRTAFMDLDMIQAFSDLTGAAFQIIIDTAGYGTVARHQAMIIPKDDRIIHVCHLVYSMMGHYRPCIRITDTGDSRETTLEEILQVARMVESLRIQHAKDISAYEAADLVAQQALESDMAEVGLNSTAGNGGTADAIRPNRRQRKIAKRIAMAAAEAVRIAEETNADATGVVLDQATVHEHKAYQDAVYIVDDTEAAVAVEAAALVLGQDVVCVAEEVVQQQTVPKAWKIQEAGQTSAGWEQPKQGQRGVASDHECPTPSADRRDIHDQGFNFVTAPGFQQTPGAEGIEAREISPPTNPLEFDPLEANTVPLHSDLADRVVTEEQTKTGRHDAEAPQCPRAPEFRAETSN